MQYIKPGEGRICLETLTRVNPVFTAQFPPCEETIVISDSIVTNGTASARRNIVSLQGETVIFTYTLGPYAPVTIEIELTNT